MTDAVTDPPTDLERAASWEIARHDDPGLRWVCATCHLIGAEHPRPWWCCSGRWVSGPGRFTS